MAYGQIDKEWLRYPKGKVVSLALVLVATVSVFAGTVAVQNYKVKNSEAAGAKDKLKGKLVKTIEDDFEKNKSIISYSIRKDDGDEVMISSGVKKLEKLAPFTEVTLSGTQKNDRTFSVGRIIKQAKSRSRSGQSNSFGTKKIRVVLANFSSVPPVYPKEYYEKIILSSKNSHSVNSFMQKVSKGRFSLDETNSVVHDWINKDFLAGAQCNYQTLGDTMLSVKNDLTSAGINLYDPAYLSVFYVVQHEGCLNMAFAILGDGFTTPLEVYMVVSVNPETTNQDYSYTLAHELGHNLGLLHANFLNCFDFAYGGYSNCSAYEYDNPFTSMGRFYREFNAPERKLIGWLETDDMTTHSSTNSYRIYPLTNNDNNLKLVKIPQMIEGLNNFYYVSYRTSSGTFDNFDYQYAFSPKPNGVAVEMAKDTTYFATYLIDTKPQSVEFDAADSLMSTNGSKFRDKVNNIEITLNNLTNTYADISVGEVTADPNCSLTPETGQCKALHIKYYFDQADGQCKTFIWGGCDGVVPFDSLAECKNACM